MFLVRKILRKNLLSKTYPVSFVFTKEFSKQRRKYISRIL